MKVGDYVRTRQGNIFKWDKYMTTIKEECREVDSPYIYINLEDIVKSSPNIIDLIEAGDYVNGHKVIDIAQAPKKALYVEDKEQKCGLIPITNEDISSVVTKEQFSSMEYKIER